MISIGMVTFNRLKLLKKCYVNVLLKTSPLTKEIVIWNNGSIDGTKEYLDSLNDKKLKIIHHHKNIGVNARAKVFSLTEHDYIISLDDDVIDAPENWDEILYNAYRKLPEIRFLSSYIIDDGEGTHARYMFRQRKIQNKKTVNIEGCDLIMGSAGAWCAITDRAAYDEVGGMKENKKFVFWNEDTLYKKELMDKGYQSAILKNLCVFHAAGPYYLNDKRIQKEKDKYFKVLFGKSKLQKIKSRIKKWFIAD
jgi:GT2 family glycosyltransferase